MTDLTHVEEENVEEVASPSGSKSPSDDEDLNSNSSKSETAASDSSSDDDESDDSESISDEDSSEAESMTDGSVFDAFDQEKAQSQEAKEAKIVQEFQTTLHLLAAGEQTKALSKFKKILSNPLVNCFHTEQYDWEKFDTEEHTHSKMAKVFVGVHKNLASLESEDAVDHYCQILSVNPNNPQIWVDLALKCVEKGDLHFAQYALQRANTEDSQELLIDVLFLSKQYHECLNTIKSSIDQHGPSDKLLFMKKKIRSINNHYREYCNDVFSDSSYYDAEEQIPKNVMTELTSRFARAEERQRLIVQSELDQKNDILEPIEVPIDSEYSLTHVLTIFCDLFDRIESYSSLIRRKVHFPSWYPRSNYLDVNDAVADMVDIVTTLEDVVAQVDICCREASTSKGSENIMKKAEKDVAQAVRRIGRRAQEVDSCDEGISAASSRESTVTRDTNYTSSTGRAGPYVRCGLARRLGLRYTEVRPLQSAAHVASRSPSPFGVIKKLLNENEFLETLREELSSRDWNMFNLISTALVCLSQVCPAKGSLPDALNEVVTQLYRRLNRMASCLDADEYVSLHLLMYELGEPAGEDYCLRRHAVAGWNTRETGLRFLWIHARAITDQNLRLAYLETLADALQEDEVFYTAVGVLTQTQVNSSLEKNLKEVRANSIKALREAKLWETIVFIAENDLDLASTDEDELREILSFWMESLKELSRNTAILELCNRFIYHIINLGPEEQNESDMNLINNWLEDISLNEIPNDVINTFCCLMCSLTSLFPNNWKMWVNLHKGLKALEDREPDCLSYTASLNSDDHSDQLPLHSLDILLQAHVSLGEDQCCTVDKCAFLIYYMTQFRDILRNEQLVKLVLSEKYSFLWNTMSEEIAQLLHCVFGRYCKKRKTVEDHGPHGKLKVTDDLAKLAIEVALPYPIPQFDDKERLGHEVIELLQSRFASKIVATEERQSSVEKFDLWLKTKAVNKANSTKGIVSWPRCKLDETSLQANIWYVMALHYYRQNNIEFTVKYTKLFLTSPQATVSNRLTLSGWAMLAHSTMSTLLSMEGDQMLSNWEWSTMPYKIAISICDSIPILHFQLANGLYQMSTVMRRAIDLIPEDDIRMKRIPNIGQLREQSRLHFEAVLGQAQTTDESCWLSLFFLGKLAAKADSVDIVKVVDYIYEAACACELGGFYYYPAKINSKKQQYIEPVELHYQVHSYVWKWLSREVSPSETALLATIGYLRAFKSHKVVRSTSSLFTILPDVHSLMAELTNQVVVEHETDKSMILSDSIDDLDISLTMDDVVNRSDLIDEVWELCYKGFELVVDRFPHMKASYRLAEMELSRGNIQKGADHLVKGVFRRKKKEDAYFDNIIEITSSDIDRAGSFVFHCDRAIDLMIRVAHRQKDMASIIQIIFALVKMINESNEGFLAPHAQRKHLQHALHLIKKDFAASHLKTARPELVKLFQYLQKLTTKFNMARLFAALKSIIEPFAGSVDEMIAKHNEGEDLKKRMQRKRKMTTFDLAQAARGAKSSDSQVPEQPTANNLTQALPPPPQVDPDCQIIEDPAVLMQRAMLAAAGIGG